jgi:glutamate--cysteine ligase
VRSCADQYSVCVLALMSGTPRAPKLTRMRTEMAVSELFRPARCPGQVGAEVELIPVADDGSPVDPAELRFDAAFVRAAVPSFEPGGQLELSPPPRRTVPALVTELRRLLARADRLAAHRGVRLVATGTDPTHTVAQVPLRTPTRRYLAMQETFDEHGPDGRRMMRLTASLQVTVDLLPGDAGREQWLVANLAGPTLAAAFANSPVLDGRPAGIPGARTAIWRGIDPRRTGYDGRHVDAADPVGAYAAFAMAAPRLPIAAAADPAYHLTTLFPPVRPRGGYLELRFLDAQPPQRLGTAIATVVALLADGQTRRDALDLLRPAVTDLGAAWDDAARGVAPLAADLLAIAGQRALVGAS